MKLISTDLGQVFLPLAMEELRPIYPHTEPPPHVLAEKIRERYKFVTLPSWVDFATKGAKFETGAISIGDREIVISSISVFNDGLIFLTRDTRDSQLIMDDFLAWLAADLNFRKPTSQLVPQFGSHIIVEFAPSVDAALKFTESTRASYQKILNSLYGWTASVEIQRIAMAVDPIHLPRADRYATFSIERRANVPYTANRWFSGAPIPTDMHLQLLSELEANLEK